MLVRDGKNVDPAFGRLHDVLTNPLHLVGGVLRSHRDAAVDEDREVAPVAALEPDQDAVAEAVTIDPNGRTPSPLPPARRCAGPGVPPCGTGCLRLRFEAAYFCPGDGSTTGPRCFLVHRFSSSARRGGEARTVLRARSPGAA